MLTVMTFLWDDPAFRWRDKFSYTPEHVDRLARAVRRNMAMPYRFVVVTDQPAGAFSEVDDVVPLWDDLRDLGRCYTRLKCFDREVDERLGDRFVWIDLDCIVLGDLTPLFDRNEEFIIWRFDARDIYRRSNRYCGSMVMMARGIRHIVWEWFDREQSPALTREEGLIGSDQAWIEYVLGPGEAVWGRRDGVLSFRGHFAAKNALPGMAARQGRGQSVPDDARIVFLHGQWDASMPSLRADFPWIEENWRQYAA